MTLNETHSPDLKSWVESANDPACPFPIQNLPFGIFSTPREPKERAGVAIGNQILDLGLLEKAGLLNTSEPLFGGPDLNPFMAQGATVWSAVRRQISRALSLGQSRLRDYPKVLTPLAEAGLHLPFRVSGFTDFYASREHATHVGTMFRGADNALMANWLHMPVGYNGRASTVVVSGTDIRRPRGQIKPADGSGPIYAASRKLDMELEIGSVVGPPTAMGTSVSVDQAQDMIFGFVLLNDWSARDIQVWEYQPLGPFLGKAFATTLSPWVVTREALEPFRVAGPVQDPAPLAYLHQTQPLNYDVCLAARLNGQTIAETNFKTLYWSSAQQLAHHTSGGCAMRTGDLLGSGTISGARPGTMGSLLELTWNGERPIHLGNGERRTFLEDGDHLCLDGHAQGDGFRIGFGEAAATVLPAAGDGDLSDSIAI